LTIFWTSVESPIGKLKLASTETGLCKIAFSNEPDAEFFEGLPERLGGIMEEDHGRNIEVVAQLKEYFGGQRHTFSLPIDLRGTSFQLSVWSELTKIPFGETRTYRQIAEAVGSPKACRAVGAANSLNQVPIVVPCHRVIGAAGNLVGFGGGLDTKKFLLRLEGLNL
jgi:methylated-DNA-[protein]-cysteine S-methyltransferase